MLEQASFRITRITSSKGFGKIVYGYRVDLGTKFNDRSSPLVVSVLEQVFPVEAISVGEIYYVSGEKTDDRVRRHGKKIITDPQIEAKELILLRPSGQHIVNWLTNHVKGVGEVKAQRCFDELGDKIFIALDSVDHDAFAPFIKNEYQRIDLFNAWLKYGDTETLKWVQDNNFPLRLVQRAWRFHGRSLKKNLIKDPYCLLSFCGKWEVIDRIATLNLGVEQLSEIRLRAAIEQSVYACSDRGHTLERKGKIFSAARRLIGPTNVPTESLERALEVAVNETQVVLIKGAGSNYLQAPGMRIMEQYCAQYINNALNSPTDNQRRLFIQDVDSLIDEFEEIEKTSTKCPDFQLTNEQRKAIKISFQNRFSVITGGAGVGKTTVLKALYFLMDTIGLPRFQMALSGMAAARMTEATQEKATTIAKFLIAASKKEMGSSPIIIIDECSMVDISLFYRILNKVPPEAHIVMVGDPYQLPPIGAGLVLHCLYKIKNIPLTELKVVKRQSKDSGILEVASSVRLGKVPCITSVRSEDVIWIHRASSESGLLRQVLELYEIDKKNTQILSATKTLNKLINRIAHETYTDRNNTIDFMNNRSDRMEDSGFRLDDLIMFTKNDWQRDIQNGLLGQIVEVYNSPRQLDLPGEERPAVSYGKALVGKTRVVELTERELMFLSHAYSITVHKSQGNQFRRVIVPLTRSKLLDRTLIYTAITRATDKVVIIGDKKEFADSVKSEPHAFFRQVGLHDLLAEHGTQKVD